MAAVPKRRFFALAFIGCVLLLIYQVVFMARTSAARDLNHIRSSRLTIQQAERFVLHNASEARISTTISGLIRHGIQRDQLLLDAIPRSRRYMLPHHAPSLYVRSMAVGEYSFPVSSYTGLFRLKNAPEKIELRREEIFVMQFQPELSIDNVVQYAVDHGYKAVLYVVHPGWSPKFGAREFPIPVVVTSSVPSLRGAPVRLMFGHSDDRVIEKTIPGLIGETVLVVESGGRPEGLAVFAEMAYVFEALLSRGWRPYRTIRFVSLPRFSADIWAHNERRWITRKVVAFIDASAALGISTSPLLNRTMEWAINTLVEGGLCSTVPQHSAINPPDGCNVFEYDFQIPSISSALHDPLATTRLLTLALASIALETVIPFEVSSYSSLLKSTQFTAAAAEFDHDVEFLKFEFTREYPWYQGIKKLGAVFDLKRANSRLVHFEKQLRGKSGKHVVFANDKADVGTVISPDPSEVSEVVDKLINKGYLLL